MSIRLSSKWLAAGILCLAVVSCWILVELLQRRRGPEVTSNESTTGSSARQADAVPAVPGHQGPIAMPTDGYVTSDACKDCHPRHFDTWHQSYHRTMTQVATPQAFMGTVDETLTRFGSTYGVERRGDEFWGFQIQDGRRAEERIVMTTGSHHMQVCWYAAPEDGGSKEDGSTDRTLGQFPLVYLAEAKRWVPRNSVFLQPPTNAPPPNETGRWNMSCIRCHATHGRPNDWDSRVAEFGIACEACHGPAEQHVAFHSSDAKPDETSTSVAIQDVVNPTNLENTAAAQVCGQCHGVWELATEEQIEQWNHRGFPYRPGDDLHAHRVTFHPGADLDTPELREILKRDPGFIRDAFWSDGMVRVSGREYNGLLGSPCFQSGALNCLHCHSLHKREDDTRDAAEWANDQLIFEMDGNKACTQCHENLREEEQVAAHTHHLAGSTGSLCYNCHMPYTTYGLLKAIRSHQISSPDVHESVEIGRPNACNQCHLNRSMGWAAEHLSQWYDISPPALDRQQQDIAASILWATRGDAGQRALAAWSFGWEAAREASGEDWIAPFLTLLIADAYDAIRYIAGRSLIRFRGFANFKFDFLADPQQLIRVQERALTRWQDNQAADRPHDAGLLLDAQGNIDFGRLQALINTRDNRPVFLAE